MRVCVCAFIERGGIPRDGTRGSLPRLIQPPTMSADAHELASVFRHDNGRRRTFSTLLTASEAPARPSENFHCYYTRHSSLEEMSSLNG